MSRRWFSEKAQALLPSLLGFDAFVDQLPSLTNSSTQDAHEGSTLADNAELYSVYAALYSRGLQPTVAASTDGAFHYLLLPRTTVAPVAASALQASGGELVEPIVPISAACQALAFERLEQIMSSLDNPPGYYKLALVDLDGTVTISKVHVGVQSPEEKIVANTDEQEDV